MEDITQLKNIKKGLYVLIDVDKTHEECFGFIDMILSKKDDKKGIRVLLQNGKQGRIIDIPSLHDLQTQQFKFFNLFFHQPLYLIRHRHTKEWIVVSLKTSEGSCSTLFISSTPSPSHLTLKPEWYWQKISSQKWITSLFKNHHIEWVYLDQSKKLTWDQFKQFEAQFKEMP